MFYNAKQNSVYLEDKLDCLQYRISQLAIESSTQSLAKVELPKHVKVQLPEDYQLAVERFGQFELPTDCWFVDCRMIDFIEFQKTQFDLYSKFHREGRPLAVHDAYPVLPGLIAFGGSFEGDLVGWFAFSSDRHWPIFVYSPAQRRFELHECTFLDWLIAQLPLIT